MTGSTLPPSSLDQRRLLGAFLRSHREALSPDAPGLRGAERRGRRTPGLRREDVAERCGLSTTWYTWIEQGRDIAVSASALARLADALRLSPPERSYMFQLAERRDPAPPAPPAAAPELVAALEAISAPAYLLDRLWNVRGANNPARRLFASWFGSGESCLLRYVFLDPAARAFIPDWENRAQRLLAEFRADTAHDLHDPAMQRLVADLTRESPLFTSLWASHDVMAREGGTRLFHHPEDGLLRYEQVTLVPAIHPGHKLVLLLTDARSDDPMVKRGRNETSPPPEKRPL